MQLKIEIPANDDLWDGEKFIHLNKQTLILMHSLVSISKWEQKNKKSFFNTICNGMTPEGLKDYIVCMTINTVDPLVYDVLTPQDLKNIKDYIEDPMTATEFINFKHPSAKRKEILTSELIYYKMIKCGIPLEFEKRHINTLITLIRVFDIKDGNVQKMTRNEVGRLQHKINEQRLSKR